MSVQKNVMRGLALPMVLIALVVLLMMAGAFIGVNRTNFAQVNSSERRDQARAACEAVYNYVQYRLEHDKYFAASNFIENATDLELGLEMDVKEVQGTRRIEGSIRSLNCEFEATIFNNLNNDAESADGVPAESALVRVTADSRGISRSIETLIKVAPLFDSSALSRGTMTIEADNFYVRSRDPYRNLVRAEGEIHVPNVLGGQSRTRFLEADGTDVDGKGMIWSKDKIFTGSNDVATELADANASSGGRFVPEAKQHFEIYDLKPDDIETPSSSIPVAAGEYRFTMATANLKLTSTSVTSKTTKTKEGSKTTTTPHGANWETTQEIHVLEYYANPDDPYPTKVYRSDTRQDDIPPPPLPGTVTSNEITEVEIVYDTAGISSSIPVTIGDTVHLDVNPATPEDIHSVSPDPKVSVNLASQDVLLPPGGTVTAAGDFKITTDRGEPPQINLGSDATSRAAIVAAGNINLEAGVTHGYGTLAATKGNLSLRPTGTNSLDVSANGQDGLVAYASNDVILENPSDTGDWTFNGLVYARNNFDFNAKGADATIEGTLVARNGNINFKEAGEVDFVYNPDYLNAMVRDLPESRLQVEKVYWKE